jgi:hypothetical protein
MSTDKQKQNAENAPREVKERRAREEEQARKRAKEVGGREGPEATRFGDWEKNGIISDF